MTTVVERDRWVQRVLGVNVTRAGAAPDVAGAQRAWAESRAAVVGTLRALEGAIRAMKDPQGDAAIILVRAISANLTAAPADRSSVAELRRYLDTDRIIDDAEVPNGFGIVVDIRGRLAPALSALERAFAA